ncbi:glycosyltransferase family 2 protein [Marinobacterium sediminicola]|nr:glycosyltransferase family 2 protein [Marinobacterium sediminicola]ULG69100.1 glycosyltransferase family 2 protein [Marinobacterium sediminicola]
MTNNTLPISVTIITLDEAERIGMAIESVRDWVDEVIIVDSGSTDGTQNIAAALGAKVIHHDWPGYGLQKRFAEDQAKNDWILNIDADERILPELKSEIVTLFTESSRQADGYFIAIHDRLYCSNRLSTYTPYKPVRLYRKSKGRYSTSTVHDRVHMLPGSKTAELKGRMAHDSLRSFHQRIEKMNEYTEAQSDDMLARGRKPSTFRILTELWIYFIVGYFFRGYWRGGLMGYIYAVNFAYSRFLRQIKLFEKEHKKKNSILY